MLIPSWKFLILFCIIVPAVCMAKVKDEKSQKRTKRFNSPTNTKKSGFSDNDEDYFLEETEREIKKTIPMPKSHYTKGSARQDNGEVDIQVKLNNPREQVIIEKDRRIVNNRKNVGFNDNSKETNILPPLKMNVDDNNLQDADTALIRKSSKANGVEIQGFVEDVARKILSEADEYYEELGIQMKVDSSFSGYPAADYPQLHEIEDDDLDALFLPSSVSLASSHLVNSGVDGDNDVSQYDYGRQADGFNTEC